MFWRLLGSNKPSRNPNRRKAFRRAFQDLWVSSALGTFFFVAARSLSVDLGTATWQFDTTYTLDRVLRYGYLLWLIAYFFVAGMENKEKEKEETNWNPNWRELSYDIAQSVLSFVAALCLGFILPDLRYTLGAYAVTNLAIGAICGMAWLYFGKGWWPVGVDRLRLTGLIVAAASVVVAARCPWEIGTLAVFATLQFVLWLVLFAYIRIRLDVSN